MANSEPAGIGSPTRISAFPRSNLYAISRASGVDTSAVGAVAPSTVRNRGSSWSFEGAEELEGRTPLYPPNTNAANAGVSCHPLSAGWQVSQNLPLELGPAVTSTLSVSGSS